MKTALRYRLFRAGKMPAELRQAAAGSTVLAAEGISVKESVRGLRLPGARVSTGSSLRVGSLVVAPGRLLAAIGSRKILDTGHQDASAPRATLACAADGLRLKLDIADIVDGGAGSLEVHYRLALDAPALGALPPTGTGVALTDAEALLTPWHRSRAA